MNTKTSFGPWLRQRRKALDLTQEDLARYVGCAANTIYKIEADERHPSKQLAELLAEHLNIAPAERVAFVNFARTEAVESTASWGAPFHPPTNLLPQPTLLIGREEDVSRLYKRLNQPECRMLTLIGPPGIGKTRLAIQVAAEALDNFAEGVFFIALAPISDASLVPATIANTLGVPDVGPRTPLERLKAFLRDKQTLLLLDNFEQILLAASQIAELLTVCPLLKILATSRAPLRIRQERQIPVSSLGVPDLARLPDIENLTQYSAVTLFVERARAVQPDFSLSHDNAPAIAAICARLDGLPLAIELISARVKLLSLAALLERLSGRLMLQSDGLRDLEPRHRTLNAAIGWSYQLLNAEEQMLFRRLGVFVGGWTLEAAEAVCLGNLDLNILDGLASLFDKNLVKRDGERRFMLLETIRTYALEQLAVNGELDYLRERHAGYFTAFAEHIEQDHVQWLNNLETELDNLRVALTSPVTGLRLAVALGTFVQQRGPLNEGSVWLTDALRRQELGTLTAADRTLRATALSWLGTFRTWQGDLDSALPSHEESVLLFRELGDPAGLAEALSTYAMLFMTRGDFEQAVPVLEESLVLSRELRNIHLIAQCLNFLGILAYSQNCVQQAGAFWEECLVLRREDGKTWPIATMLAFLAMVALEQGDNGRARRQLVESLTLLRALGERWQTAHTLEVFAGLAVRQAQPDLVRAALIFGAAEVFRETLSAPVLPFQRHFNERGIATLRAQLDEATLATVWAKGRAMTLEEALAYALEV